MAHRAATPGRAFSTTSIKNWQYTYGQALLIAGPALKKAAKRTQVNNGNKGTAMQPLPVALNFMQPPQLPIPDLQKTSPRKWAELVQAIPDPSEQAVMENDDAVMCLSPYVWQVCKYLTPDILRSYGFAGTLDFQPQITMRGSRPDRIVQYNGRAIIAFDFKGPNCIVERELRICEASTTEEALDKLATIAGNEDGEQGLTLLNSKGVTLETRTLIKQGVKYQRQIGTPTVIFYDYDYLMIMKPPPDLEEQNQQVMGVILCQEVEISTEEKLVMCRDNHVAVLIRCIIEAVQKLEQSTEASMKGRESILKTVGSDSPLNS